MTGFCLVEGTAEIACSGDTVLLLNAAHLHAHMLGLNDHHDTEGIQGGLDTVFDLGRKAFLYLKTTRIDIDDACDLTQAGDTTVRDIGHVHLSEEG